MPKQRVTQSKKETSKAVRRRQAIGVLQRNDDHDAAAHGIVIHANFKPLYANAAFAAMMGFASPKEVLAMPLLRPLVPPENWPRIEASNGALLRGEETQAQFRERLLKQDGTEIWLMGARRVIRWQGKPAVQVDVFDVSAHMQAETRLMHSEQKLLSVLALLPVPLVIVSAETGRLLHVNRKACLQLGASAAALMRGTLEPFVTDLMQFSTIRVQVDATGEATEADLAMRNAQQQPFIAEVAAIRLDYNGQPAILYSFTDVSERKRTENQLKLQALTDDLTGVSNRRHFFAVAEHEVHRAVRYRRPLSVLTLDIDHFKRVNDTHGHAVGDAVIQALARLAQDRLRMTDLLARTGGEEFVVLLPETDLAGAALTAERMRAAVAVARLPTPAGELTCTISIGVAQLAAHETLDALLSRADAALYRAKNGGRNRVEQG